MAGSVHLDLSDGWFAHVQGMTRRGLVQKHRALSLQARVGQRGYAGQLLLLQSVGAGI